MILGVKTAQTMKKTGIICLKLRETTLASALLLESFGSASFPI